MNEQLKLISSMNEDEQCLIQQFSSPAKCIFVASALISLSVGTVMKSFVYGNLKQMKLKNRPINILILTELRIHHFCSDIFLGWSPTLRQANCLRMSSGNFQRRNWQCINTLLDSDKFDCILKEV
jgi:hypothetical protein